MKVKAAIAIEKGKSLIIDHVDLEGPKKGEVLVEIKSTGVCHTDAFTLSGADPEGIFPSILGHEGAGVVVDVGEGVESLKKDVDFTIKNKFHFIYRRAIRLQFVIISLNTFRH